MHSEVLNNRNIYVNLLNLQTVKCLSNLRAAHSVCMYNTYMKIQTARKQRNSFEAY